MYPILFPKEFDEIWLAASDTNDLEDANGTMLYASGASLVRDFDSTRGFGALSDAITCTVTEERNGEYDLEMEYPITGIHYNEIGLRSVIVAEANTAGGDWQAFRVYQIDSPINGVVTVYAHHISYDMGAITVSPFEADGVAASLQGLKNHAVDPCPFSFATDKSVAGTFKVDVPSTLREWLAGKEGSILDIFGTGEYEFDNYSVYLHLHRGQDRGVRISYGKNLVDFRQEANSNAVYTGVYPFWKGGDAENPTIITLPEKVVEAAGTYDFVRTYPLDLSSKFENEPTEVQLRAAAQNYISANNIGVPDVSIELDFVQISEYITDRVELCDTVHIFFPALNIEATAECIKTEYNVLLGRYDKIELGNAKTSSFANTMSGILQEAQKTMASKSFLEERIAQATGLITGNSGGYIVIHDSDGDGYPDELLIMDTPDISTATNVWRWNQQGLGHATSYDGDYSLAMTADGQIVADAITAGTLRGVELISESTGKKVDIVDGTVTAHGALRYAFDGQVFNSSAVLSNGSLRLVDEYGHVIAFVGSTGTATQINGGYIYVRKPDGDFLAFMAPQRWADDKIGGTVRIMGFNNDTIGMLNCDNGGAGNLVLRYPNGSTAAQLARDASGNMHLWIFDENGTQTGYL